MSIENEIVREDWISRFFGFLGSFQYIRDKEKANPETAESKERKADNIVYIYGPDKNGMPEYKKVLIDELKNSNKYACCEYSFEDLGFQAKYKTECVQFQKDFASHFETDVDFYFPCIEMLNESKDWSVTSGIFGEMLDSASKILAGINIPDGITLLGRGMEFAEKKLLLKTYIKNLTLEKKKIFEQLVETAKEKQKSGKNPATLLSEEDIFCYLGFDLETNVAYMEHEKGAKKPICIISEFELFEEHINEKYGASFLNMMMEVKDVIWVLFSSEKPSDCVRESIREENCWRMAGINRERTISYLKSKCPEDKNERWYDSWCEGVYANTGGYLELIRLCIEEQKSGEKYSGSQEDRYRKTLREFGHEDQEIDEMIEKKKKENPTLFEEVSLEKWFAKICKDKDMVKLLLKKEYKDAEDTKAESPLYYNLLPCMCFLADKSKDKLGTINQFSWKSVSKRKKGEPLDNVFKDLSELGTRCINYIENSTPFCIEYVEFPNVLYLDPVIVRILMVHEKFPIWLERFQKDGFYNYQSNSEELEDSPSSQNTIDTAVVHQKDRNSSKIYYNNSIKEEKDTSLIEEKEDEKSEKQLEEQDETGRAEMEMKNEVASRSAVTHNEHEILDNPRKEAIEVTEKIADNVVSENKPDVQDGDLNILPSKVIDFRNYKSNKANIKAGKP